MRAFTFVVARGRVGVVRVLRGVVARVGLDFVFRAGLTARLVFVSGAGSAFGVVALRSGVDVCLGFAVSGWDASGFLSTVVGAFSAGGDAGGDPPWGAGAGG